MDVIQLIDAVQNAGATIEVDAEGKAHVRGARIPEELLAQVKRQRGAVIEEVKRRMTANTDRWGKVPPGAVAPAGRDLAADERTKQLVMDYMMRQGRVVHAWVMAQEDVYAKLGVPPVDTAWRACVDLAAWQRNCSVAAALEFVQGLQESVDTFLTMKE